MNIYHDLDSFSLPGSPIALSIGNFDGVHKGHQFILKHLKAKKGHSIVLTFSNHPSSILSLHPKKSITPLARRLELLKKEGIDSVIVLDFTRELSRLTAREFLISLRKKLPFTHLVLGADARLGAERKGDTSEIQLIAEEQGFQCEYLSPYLLEGTPVSSTLIRLCIEKGDFQKAEAFLGRPYSICGKVEKGKALGRLLGFKTLNLSLETMTTPPLGVYAVETIYKNISYQGVANLGFAPTLQERNTPLLEVHLLSLDQELYGQSVEVIFKKFLREEKRFLNMAELKAQIEKDLIYSGFDSNNQL